MKSVVAGVSLLLLTTVVGAQSPASPSARPPLALNMLTPLMRSDDDEGRLFRSIYCSKVQPQGTCVLNSAGQVLAWVLMYDKNQSVLDFLDHSRKRYEAYPSGEEAVAAERYMRFPSAQLEDFQEEPKPTAIVQGHLDAKSCLAQPPLAEGTLTARVFGRAVDEQGEFLGTVNQEHFALDRFEVTPAMQDRLTKALADAGTSRVRIPVDFARLCMAYAFLGNKDSGPMSQVSVFRIASDVKQCEFWARKVDGTTPVWRVEGKTEVVGQGAQGGRAASAPHFGLKHEVKLTWEGFIEIDGDRITRLLLSANGTEKLKWGSVGLKAQAETDDEVAFLPSGRFIDMECGVRYGIAGEPVGEENKLKEAGALLDEAFKGLEEPLAIGGRLGLFVDDRLIEQSEGVHLVLHKPIPREIALQIDQPWEKMKLQEKPVLTDGAFDSLNVAFWDTERKQYVAYYRDYYPLGEAAYVAAHYDSVKFNRDIKRATSDDFVDWTKGEWLDYGGPREPLYTIAITPYFRAPHILVAFPKRFVFNRKKIAEHPYEGLSDGVFMSSRDGRHWNRRFVEAFIDHGPDRENWTERNPLPTWGVVPTGPAEMSVYWVEHFRHPTNRIRRGTLRTDGFVSAHAGLPGGDFLTRPLTFAGQRLVLNYATSAAGSVRVEVLTPRGEAIPRLSLEGAPELYGDSVAEEYRWNSKGEIAKWAGKPVRLRFHLKDADVYSLCFTP